MSYLASESRYEKMKYNRCGASGLHLPAVSLGLWHNFGSCDSFDNMKDICFTAFDHGITHFDLANNYGPIPGSAEENFGRIMSQDMYVYRDEMVISSKAGYTMWPGPYGDWGSRKYILASLDQSLKRMGLDYVDIFYHHRRDPKTPMEESMMALDQAVKSGKALYAGISNYDLESTMQAVEILKDLKCPFIINQRRYSMLDTRIEKEGLKDWCAKNGVGIIAFSPLEQGMLTGKYLKEIPADSRMASKNSKFLNEEKYTPKVREAVEALHEIAVAREESLAQMALAWILKDEEVCSVLIGVSRPSQIMENLGILESKPFSKSDLETIQQISATCALF